MSARINAFLQLGREQGCSDIHFAVGCPPMLRIMGELAPIRYRELAEEELRSLVYEVLDESRKQEFESGHDVAATVSAPAGWHRVVATGRSSGHVVLVVRFSELTSSRWHNVERALRDQGNWDPDDDGEGVTRRFPPGTEAATVAFELLAALTLAGAPADTRTVTIGT